MVLPSFRKLGKTTRTSKTPRRRKLPAWQLLFRPRFEPLEELTLPSTVTWIGGSGDWDTAANWSTGLVPGGGDDVVINSGSPTHGLTNTDAVHSITNSVPVAVAAGTLTVGGGTSQINAAVTVSSGATLTLNSSTVNGSGTLTNSGTLNITSSTLTAAVVNQGTLMNFGGDTFNGTLSNAAGATLWVQGNSTAGSATLTSANGFTNDGTLRLESINSSWSEALTISSGTFTNASDGTLLVNPGTGGNRTLTGNFTNQGTVTVGAGVTFPETGSSPTFTQAGGTFTVDPAGLFYVSGGSITFTGGAVSGPVFGTGSTTLNVTAGVTAPSTVYLNDGTLVNNLSPAVTVWLQGNSTFGNSSTSLAANATNAGTLHLESANNTYSSNFTSNGFTLTNTGTISVGLGSGGPQRSISGNLVNQGQIIIDSDASLYIQNGTYTAAGGTITGPGYVVNDTIRETASPAAPSTIVLVSAATLATDNLAGYTLWVQGDNLGGSITLTAASSFTNHGTLRLESIVSNYNEALTISSGTLTNAADGTLLFNLGTGGSRSLTGSLTNQGTVNATAGGTTFTGNVANAGQINVDSAASLSIQNGTYTAAGGTITGPAVLNTDTIVETASPATPSTMVLVNYATLASDNLAGYTLWVQGDNIGGSITLTTPGSFTNHGTLRLESTVSTYTSAISVGSGNTLTNAADGTLLVNAGSGGARALTGNLTNQGTVTVGAGATFTETGSSPTFTQAGGTFTVDPAGLFYVSGGSITFTGGAVSGPVFGTGSTTLNVTAGVTAPSTVYLNDGTLVNNLSPAVTVWLQGNSTFGNSSTSLAANATNAGTLHLESANNTYSSNFTSNGFTLTNTGTISVGLGSGGSRTFSGNLTNSGQVSVDSNAFLSIQSGTYTAAGGTITGPAVLNTDTIQETASPPTPSTIVLVNYATLATDNLAGYTLWVRGESFGGNLTLTSAGSFTNHGTLRLESSDSTYDSSLTLGGGGTLTNAADGTLLVNAGSGGSRILSGNLTNQGTVTVGAGATLVLNGTLTSFSGGTLTGGTYNVSGTFQFPNAAITTNAAAIVLNGASSQIVNQSNVNALANFATNTAAGSFTIQNSRNFTSTAPFSNAGNLTVGSSSTFTASGNYTQSAGSTTLAGGTLTAGSIAINGGALSGVGTVNGNVTNAGQVNPGGTGAAGLLTITGNYTQTSAGVLNIELGGTTADSQFDQLAVSGTATLAGTLNINLISSFLPAIPNTFQILPFGSESGDFATKNGLNAGNGIVFTTVYNASNLTLGTTAITTTTVTASTATPVYGQTITFTATVSTIAPGASTPSGSVTFTVDGNPQAPIALSGGQAMLSLILPVGTHTISAAYSPVSYFLASTGSVTPSVAPAPLTITADNQMMTYGGTLPTLTVTYTGLVNGDTPATFTMMGNTPPTLSTVAANSHAGSYAITVSGAVDPNYTITFVNGTLTINPAALTITANNQAMTYGGSLPALTASYSGLVNGDTPAVFNAMGNTPPTLSTVAASSHAGSYTISASGAVDPDYTITFAPGTLTINPAALTITANNQAMTYGGSLPALTASYSGLVNGDTPAVFNAMGNTPPTLSTVAASSHAGSYTISVSGAADPDYSITFVNGTLTINPAALTISADNKAMTYGGSLPTLTASYMGLANGDTPATFNSAPNTPPSLSKVAASSHAGSYAINISGAVDPDYSITFVNGTLTINPAALTISADNKMMTYGGTLPTLTASYTGLTNGDTPAVFNAMGNTPPTLSTVAATSHAGTYAITASGAVDPDYTITFAPGTLTINPAALTITANNQAMTYGGSLPALTASYSGLVNGDTPAVFNAMGNTPPTLSTVAASSHAGSYAISVSGAVDPDYTITFVNGTLTIAPAALTISADDKAMTYGGSLPALTAGYSGLVNGDTPAVFNAMGNTPPTLSTVAATSHAGSYAITVSGAADPDYTITFVNGTLTINPAALTITADNQTMIYGGSLPALTVSYSGFVNGDTPASLTTPPTLATTATATSHVGLYAITASGAVDADYTISYVAGNLTINPAALTITANDQTMVYGGTLPTLTAGYSGFVNGDTPASLTTPPTLATTAAAASHVGSYAITARGAVDPDYAISYVYGTLTITPAPLTITADNQTMIYGGTPPALTVSYSGFVNGDTSASLTTAPTASTTATAASHVGSYAITVSGAVDADYAISYNNGTLTITPAPLTITANNRTMVYGAAVPTLTVSYSGFVNGDTPASLTTPPVLSTTATSTSPVGTYPITVTGAVDADYAISYVNGTLTITPAASATAVSSSLNPSTTGQSVTFTATVAAVAPGSGAPTGTVTFMDGSNTLGMGTLSGGMATFTTATLTVGTHSITVVYGGDGNFTGSTSAALSQAVNPTSGVPVVTGVSPNSGSTAGGTAVTISGAGFTGVTAVMFGTVAASFTFVSDSQITATAPVHAGGLVNVQVVTPNGTSVKATANQFTYLAPAVTGVSPNSGSTAGGTVITITGSNFVGVTVVHIDGVTATSFTVVSATQITATTPAHVAGTFNVRVTNAGATSTAVAADQFTYLAPAVTGVSPTAGSTAGGDVITITGSNFIGITAVHVGGVLATSFSVVSATQITATTPAHAAGTVDVRVTNAGATSAVTVADHFAYQAPAVTGVSPNVGPTLGGTVVTITGSNFIGITAVHFGTTAATSFTVVSPTQITATAPAHGLGTVAVTVSNAGATSTSTAADQFTYQGPIVSGVSPNSGTTAGGTVVTITGSNFIEVTAVNFGATPAASYTVVSATQITATAPVHAAGLVNVHVTGAGITSATATADQFTYLAPAVTGISPNAGSTAGGTVVTITGSNFIGVTAVRFGSTAATSFTVVSATQITATAPVHAGGNVDVRVVNVGAASAVVTADQFTYQAPAILGISPNSGLSTGGTVVTITGSNFVGITAVKFGGTAATSFTVVSATQITATAPAHAAGMVDVRVVNAGATSAVTAGDQFTYLTGAGPGNSGGHSDPARAELASGLEDVHGEMWSRDSRAEVSVGGSRSAGSTTTGVAPSVDAQAATLALADMENFFSAAPDVIGLGSDPWPADWLPANKTAAIDAWFAPA